MPLLLDMAVYVLCNLPPRGAMSSVIPQLIIPRYGYVSVHLYIDAL